MLTGILRRFGILAILCTLPAAVVAGQEVGRASDLRLVPFPKEVRLTGGRCSLQGPLVLEVPSAAPQTLAEQVAAELQRAGLARPEVRVAAAPHVLRLARPGTRPGPLPSLRPVATADDYALTIDADAVTVAAGGPAGLLYGTQTLRQLVRANRREGGLPCLALRDWPSLRWRCFQDDMTRGPSPTLPTLLAAVDLGCELKMNLFTYYMEYQFAFHKHPEIGPPDGSFQPDELRRLVEFGRPRGVDVLGNQQSFGHFAHILEHERYAPLRETENVLTPVREESYQLLDDLYSEVCPLLPFPFFNVCCDETLGLGTGPSKELAAQIGVGGVYARHLRRVHDLLRDNYGKRMMMWGDIILLHPEHLAEIPRDTIMLTWGYAPRESFENQILPFANSGFEFFVCPGVDNWNRILPDFGHAATNIRNFVRDGARHGTLGMLNTEWKDDGETLRGPSWHGFAWGAECAWNASTTTLEDFDRRLGAVLFGEPGDHFGRAIQRLSQAHRLAETNGLADRRFWETDFVTPRNPATTRASAQQLLEIVRPAMADLETCRQQATVNGQLLDGLLLGAQRIALLGQRQLDGLEACRLYAAACDSRPPQAAELLAQAAALAVKNRDAHAALGRRFVELWRRENKPHALDVVTARYDTLVAWYDGLNKRLAGLRQAAAAGQTLPAPEEAGLAPGAATTRRTRPRATRSTPLEPRATWEVPEATRRLGLVINAGGAARAELPVEVDVALPSDLAVQPVRAFCTVAGQAAREIVAQCDLPDGAAKPRLTLLLPGPLAKQAEARVRVYLGLPRPPAPLPQAASTRDAPRGMKWLENDKLRLLLGPEGGHVYRWEVKSLGNRNLTMPGETDWHGFADLSDGHRNTPHTLVCTAHGPALVRYRLTDPTGLVKTISLLGGVAWMEVTLRTPVERYWDFDNPLNFAADGPTPGRYLFSTGATGAVGRRADGVSAQVMAAGCRWAVKWNPQHLALGLCTPDVATRMGLAPGAGAGGVGIENPPGASHFITWGGILEAEPQETMQRLARTLGFQSPPVVTVFAVEERGEREQENRGTGERRWS